MLIEQEASRDYRGFLLSKVITFKEFENDFLHNSAIYSEMRRFTPCSFDIQLKDGMFATIGFVSDEDANRYRNWYIDNILHN